MLGGTHQDFRDAYVGHGEKKVGNHWFMASVQAHMADYFQLLLVHNHGAINGKVLALVYREVGRPDLTLCRRHYDSCGREGAWR